MTTSDGFSEAPPIQVYNATAIRGGYDPKQFGFGSIFECRGFVHNVGLIVPSALFVFYLACRAKRSFLRVSHGSSYIMTAYYGCLWLVCLLNLAWCCLRLWECSPNRELAWNILSLFTSSGIMFLEVSLLALLLQGNYTSGLEVLMRTFIVSGLIVGLDMLLKATYLFFFGVPLFIDNNGNSSWVKWGLWAVHILMLTAIYGFILFMYHSKWRERLPARPTFYYYIIIMFSSNALSLLACGFTVNGAGFGLWLTEVTTIFYHAFYLPLLYVTFLADFFQEEDMHLENVYYSEMKDAGFFDSDLE